MTASRVLAMLVVAAAVVPSPAIAQLPPLPGVPGVPVGPSPPPSGGQPQPAPDTPAPPPSGPTDGSGDVVSYRGNPQGTNASGDPEAVLGPLVKLWHKTFEGPVNQPLIVDGRVIVNIGNNAGYGSQVAAFDARTGKELWRQPTPGTYFSAPIAATGGRVFSLNSNGILRAFDIATGTPAWERGLNANSGSPGESSTPPVAARGSVFVWTGTLQSFAADTGAERWHQAIDLRSGYDPPSLDAERVFMTDGSGGAVAVAQSTGQVAWSHQGPGDSGWFGRSSVVFGGRVFATGATWDEGTGAAAQPALPRTPEAAAGDLGFVRGPDVLLRAIDLGTGQERWQFKDPGSGYSTAEVADVPPYVVGPTVYVLGKGLTLYGLDRTTGVVLSAQTVPNGGFSSVGGIHHGMAAGAGVLLVANHDGLTAFEAVLQPAPRGAAIAATAFDVVTGKTITIVGGLGRAIYSGHPRVALQRDEHPFRRFGAGTAKPADADGTGWWSAEVVKNTRFRFTGAGATSPSIVVYAQPRIRSSVRAVSPTRGRLVAAVRGARDFRPNGHRFVVYLGRVKVKRYERLGTAPLRQAGRGRARAVVGFPLPRKVNPRDFVAFCVVDLPKLGYGRNDWFQKRCGKARIAFR